MADSSTGGYLLPTDAEPLNDDALEDFFYALFTSISGLPANMVRPRWTPEGANVPPRGSDWVAQGIERTTSDIVASQWFEDGVGMHIRRNQEMESLVSVYGNNCEKTTGLMREGLSLDQNREAMRLAGIVLVKVGQTMQMPSVTGMMWWKRIDFRITFRRTIERVYPILKIQTAQQHVTANTR